MIDIAGETLTLIGTFIVDWIFKFLTFVVNLLLAPITLVINQFFPDLSNALQSITNFFDYLSDFPPFVISYLGIDRTTMTIIVLMLSTMIVVSIGITTYKLVIRWFRVVR